MSTEPRDPIDPEGFQPLGREDVAQRLRAHGIAPTRQRLDIAHCLLREHQHLSADQLRARLSGEVRALPSRATVYNTLRLLAVHGLLREVVVDPQRVFFDSNTEAHHHYFDVGHGKLIDIPAGNVEIRGLPPLPAGMVREDVEVVIRIRHR
jgi:Fur family iron response transcriptional regulator